MEVHTVGFPSIDLIMDGNYATPEELTQRFTLDATRPVLLFTQHSITTEFEEAVPQLRPSLDALTRLAHEGVQVILTYPNNDAGGESITQALEEYLVTAPQNIQLHKSLGRYAIMVCLHLPNSMIGVLPALATHRQGLRKHQFLVVPR